MSLDNNYTIFTRRLATLIGSLCSLSVLFLGIVFICFYWYQLDKINMLTLKNTNIALTQSLDLYLATVSDKLKKDLCIIQSQLDHLGKIWVDYSDMSERVVVNSDNNALVRKSLPQFKIGEHRIQEDIPKVILVENDSICIFQLIDNKLLKIAHSNNSPIEKMNWSVFYTENTPIYKAISQGKDFSTKSKIGDRWFFIRITPLFDDQKKVIGALSVGHPLLSQGLLNMIQQTLETHMTFHIYDDEGNILIHPTIKYNAKIFDIVPEFKGKKEGIIRYDYDGRAHSNYLLSLENYGLHTGLSAYDYNTIWKYVFQMILFVLTGWVIIIVIVAYVVFSEIQKIEGSIDEFRDKMIKIAVEKDYSVRFSEETNIDEYETNAYFNKIVVTLKTMNAQNVLSSQVLNFSTAKLYNIGEELSKLTETDHFESEGNKGSMLLIHNKLIKNVGEVGEKIRDLAKKIHCYTKNF